MFLAPWMLSYRADIMKIAKGPMGHYEVYKGANFLFNFLQYVLSDSIWPSCHLLWLYRQDEYLSVRILKELFFGGLQCVSNSFAYVAHFVFLRDVRIRTRRAAVPNRHDTNLATHLPTLKNLSE
jgi:hypothetical protein